MNQLDDESIQAHLRRRAGSPLEQARIDGLTRSVIARLDEQRRSLPRLFATAPFGARVGLATALVVALSLIAVPLAGGPKVSTPPSAGAATEGSTGASSADAGSLQILSLAELQRVAAHGDTAQYRDHIVVADVDLQPDDTPPPCVFALEASSPDVNPVDACWIDGFVVGASPTIRVIKPTKDIDMTTSFLPAAGIDGPVVVRIVGQNALQLVGDTRVIAGHVAWPLRSFVTTVQHLPRTMEFARGRLVLGWPYVVDAQLVNGNTFFCAMQTPASDPRLAGFACGATAWLAPTDVPDASAIVDSWNSRPGDWVRIQDGAYFRFSAHPTAASAAANPAPVHGFYLVAPVLKIDSYLCFQCDAGALAILYARLEPVAIP